MSLSAHKGSSPPLLLWRTRQRLRGGLDKIDKRKDQDPDEIDKMPVQSRHLAAMVVFGPKRPPPGQPQNNEQVNNPAGDVKAVKSRDREKSSRKEVLA